MRSSPAVRQAKRRCGTSTEARQDATGEGKSPARWLLAELSLRIGRREGEEANRLMQMLTSRHLREPGVAQQLRDILVAYGIISPDGQPAAARPAEQAAAAAATPAEDTKKNLDSGRVRIAGRDQQHPEQALGSR